VSVASAVSYGWEIGVKVKIVISIVGVIIAVFGALFGLQGFGVIGGSAMSGSSMWAIIGVVLFVIGVAIVALGQRRKR
jgi:Mg2+ and Co2+ transporter CorA